MIQRKRWRETTDKTDISCTCIDFVNHKILLWSQAGTKMKFCQFACDSSVNVSTKYLFGTRLASVLILVKFMRKRLIFFKIAKTWRLHWLFVTYHNVMTSFWIARVIVLTLRRSTAAMIDVCYNFHFFQSCRPLTGKRAPSPFPYIIVIDLNHFLYIKTWHRSGVFASLRALALV